MSKPTPEPPTQSKKTTITVHRDVKESLQKGLPWTHGETWNEKLLSLKERQIPPEVYAPLEKLIEVMESPDIGEPLLVPSLMGQIMGKIGVALGVSNSPSLTDWGVNKTIAAKVAVFASGNEKEALSILVMGSLKRLVEHYDIPELAPLMDDFKSILLTHAASALDKEIDEKE